MTWSPTFVPGTEITKPWMLKGIQAREETKSIVIPHTVLSVFGISISFKPWGFHEPKNDDHPVYSPF